MSNRRRKGKAGGGGILIIILLFVLASKGGLITNILSAGLAVLGVGALFVGIMALIVFLIIRVSKSNKGYVESQKDTRPSKNPYSVNYDQNAVDAEKQKKMENEAAKASAEQKKEQPVKEEAPKFKSTGDPDIDKMIQDKDLAISEMRRLDDAIVDEKLSEQIVHLEQVTDKIVAYIVEHPEKKNLVNKFFSYYLPTTLKLLNAYDRMDDAGISGTNIDGTKDKVEEMMDTALKAFDKQLDALFADEALDVTTDIKVMENMLKAEGLTDDPITLKL